MKHNGGNLWWWIGGGVAAYLLIRRPEIVSAERRVRYWELYDRGRNFPGATAADLQAMAARNLALARIALEIQDAVGFTDNEEQIAGAFRQLRSRYELYWLNRTFAYLFENPATAPQLGAFIDARLSDEEWAPIMRTLDTLPRFARNVNGCAHTVCGICGGVAATIHGVECRNRKCVAARGDVCECRCKGAGHRGIFSKDYKRAAGYQQELFTFK